MHYPNISVSSQLCPVAAYTDTEYVLIAMDEIGFKKAAPINIQQS